MAEMNEVFSRVRRRWLAPPLKMGEDFAGSVQDYLELQNSLQTDPDLRQLNLELYPELAPTPGAAAEEPGIHQMHMVNKMLQIMESVWLTARSDKSQSNLVTRGWMNLFRRWTSSELFRRHWLMLRGEYSLEFLRFCVRELDLLRGKPLLTPLSKWPPAEATDSHSGLAALASELAREWPLESTLEARVASALENPLVSTEGGKPLSVWLMWLNTNVDSDAPDNYKPYDTQLLKEALVCGIIVLTKFPSIERTGELFVWVRGAYRNLAIGRTCTQQVLKRVWDALKRQWRTEDYALWARYPGGADPLLTESVRVRAWLSFFYHYNFCKIAPLPSSRGRGEGTNATSLNADWKKSDLILQRHSQDIRRREVARWVDPGDVKQA